MNEADLPTKDAGWQWGARVWAAWTLGNALSWGTGWAIVSSVGMRLPGLLNFAIFVGFITAGQWFIVQRWTVQAGQWAAATAVALLVALHVTAMGQVIGGIILTALTAALSGAILGLAQWRAVRGSFRQAGRWILASILGWGLTAWRDYGFPALPPTFNTILPGSAELAVQIMNGAMYGAVTGIALVWLFRHPHGTRT